jgi:hypothetical protein
MAKRRRRGVFGASFGYIGYTGAAGSPPVSGGREAVSAKRLEQAFDRSAVEPVSAKAENTGLWL